MTVAVENAARTAGPGAPVIRATAAPAGPGSFYRAATVVFQRELIKFSRDRMRIATALLQPVLFLLVLGTGLGVLTRGSLGGGSLKALLFPGILVMAVMFTAVFSAGSIGWDREFGFLREMLVAPIGRSSIIVGKVAGGAVTSCLQGLVILALAWFADVPYDPLMIVEVAGATLLFACTMSAFGALLAAWISSVQGFMAVTQMSLMPLFFTSGALFPTSGLPAWLRIVTLANPLTYCVDPIRRIVFAVLRPGASAGSGYAAGVTWDGWRLPIGLELGVVAVLGLVLLWLAVLRFRRVQ